MHPRYHVMFVAIPSLLLLLAPSSMAAEQPPDDRDVTLAVETELILNDSVPAHRIDITTDDRVVTLSGSVDSYEAKVRAGNVAQSVKAVLEVINVIEVRPRGRSDSEIRADVVKALAVDPATEPYEIDIRVDEGLVTLEGEVNSYTERKLAEEVAETVRGVTHIENLLTYDYDTDRPRTEIRKDIIGRLRADTAINSGLIDVSVNEDGKVVLEGAVSSALEKSLAESEARAVMGVGSVENNLEVQWWLDGETDDWGDPWADRDMRQAIKNRLLYNGRVKTFNVNVSVEDGVARLAGTVDNLRAKRAAEEEASGTLGVRRVKNYLRVRPQEEAPDEEVAENVTEGLQRNPYVDRYDVTVEVRNGLVYLKGEVDSSFVKNEVEEIASSVPGVVDIHSYLEVDIEVPEKSDREIKEDIESQLWWSPFVDSDRIDVEVHGGVATLRGKVSDWSEYLAAKENAMEGGATSVLTDLNVTNGDSGS